MQYEAVGLGSSETTQIASAAVGAGGSSIASILVATGAIAGPIGAVIGAVAAGIAIVISQLFKPNLQKIQASNDANQIEQILQQNLANWLSVPTNQRYASVQAAALQVFDAGWLQYQNAVQPDLAKAPNSISDRQEGSCAYHTAQQAGWTGDTYVSNEPNQASGSCWNWFIGYRDPIANDPNVQPDPVAGAASSVTNAISSVTGISSDSIYLLLGAGVLAFALMR